MAKSKLKWGVAGCGNYAENTFIPATLLLRKSKVISLFSNSKQRAKEVAQKFGIPFTFNNYDEFLKSEINCVYVASANVHHYVQVINAARAGKNILCEKPLSINSSQAEEMVKVCKENGVYLAVNFTHRVHPIIIKAKELIDKGYIGKLVSANVSFNINFTPGNNFRFNKSLSGGGVLRDVGTHMLDLLRYFGGEIKSIDGYIDNVVYKSEVDDFSVGIVSFEKGGYGYFNVSYNSKKAFNRIEILGHNGAMSIENYIGYNPIAKLTILRDGEAKKAFRKKGNKQYLLLKSVQRSFLNNEEPFTTGEDGLITMKLMEELENKCRREKS
jgi:predicted dehydrogenase